MQKLFLLLMDGMTGSGKTTLSHMVSQHIPRVAVIGMDKVKRFISDFERGTRDNTIARDVVLEMTKAYLNHDISVIVEQPFKSDELQHYENIATHYKIPLYKFQLFTTPEMAFARITNRQKDKKDKVPEDRIRRNISLFEHRGDKGFIVIDTSSISSEDVFRMILKDMHIIIGNKF